MSYNINVSRGWAPEDRRKEMTIIFHLPTEEEVARDRMDLLPETIEEVASTYTRNLTREMYGNTENTIQFVIPTR
tara:strand:- start:81 stop:305 length:225 start_codon:yes stop_codon:yes gene_type:complete